VCDSQRRNAPVRLLAHLVSTSLLWPCLPSSRNQTVRSVRRGNLPAPREHRQPSQPRKRRPEHLGSWRKGPREPPRLGGPPLRTFHPASRCSGGSARVGEGCRRATKTSGRPSAQKQGRKTSARGRRGWTGRRGRCLRRLAGTPQPQKIKKDRPARAVLKGPLFELDFSIRTTRFLQRKPRQNHLIQPFRGDGERLTQVLPCMGIPQDPSRVCNRAGSTEPSVGCQRLPYKVKEFFIHIEKTLGIV